jgi:hypothetical protein
VISERKHRFARRLIDCHYPTIAQFRATQQQLIGIEVAQFDGRCALRSGNGLFGPIDAKESGRTDFFGSTSTLGI